MRKLLKKIGNSALSLAMMAYMFVPLTVFASQTITLTFTVEDNQAVTYVVNNGNEIGGKVGEDNGFMSFENNANHTQISSDNIVVNCSTATTCTVAITVPDGNGINVLVGGDAKYELHGNLNNITQNSEISAAVKNTNNQQQNNGGQTQQQPQDQNQQAGEQGGQQGPGTPFNGVSVVVWSCGNKICYHEFTGLKDDEVNFIKASDVTDDRDQTIKFDVHAKNKFFAVPEEFNKRKNEINDNTVKIEDLIGPDGIDYMPVGEPTENNALVAYGNREFKAIIYGDDFKGVNIGDLQELDYYPQEWNDWFLRRETYDMGGTTKENPVEIDTLLLQKKINLKLQTNLNDYSITKIEALDVPEDAVTITKKNDGSYDFEFNSNYYDKVVFKVTTSDNKEQYIYINRRTTDPWIRTDNGKEGIVVETFFDRKKSYKDLDVIAKIVFKDGSSKVVHLEAEKGIDNKLGDLIDDYEVDEQTVGDANTPKGKGMKRSNFVYSMSIDELKKVDKIYINVEFKGSTSTVFAGNFVGSGKGDVIDMKYWEDRLR